MPDTATQVSANLDALVKQFDVITHNLANVSTAGYKRRCNSFSQVLAEQGQTATSVDDENAAPVLLDFSQGHLTQTDRNLDVALFGKGFFVIETPQGPVYTRHGVFQTNQNGQIVDGMGRIVAGQAGPLVVPTTIGPADLQITAEGRVFVNESAIGQFRIVDFPDGENRLMPIGSNCFQAPEDVEPIDAEETVVRQGFQEASNVKLIDELVNMIMVSRLYEAGVKLVDTGRQATSSMLNVAMA
jgi:flagellar basal-body rod protein FlgG